MAIEYTVDGKDYYETNNLTTPYKFNGCNVTFPLEITDTSTTVIIEGKEYYVIYVYANFKWVTSYFVKYYMNDGTDNIFKTQYVYSDSNAARKGYRGALYLTVPIENPVIDGYTFRYWYLNGYGSVYDSIDLQQYSSSGMLKKTLIYNLYLYAQWIKNVTITYMMNDGTIEKAGTAVIYSDVDLRYGIVNSVKPCYTFTGWYLDADCTEETSGVDEYTTVYAKWADKSEA